MKVGCPDTHFVIPAPKRLRQEDCSEFEAGLGYTFVLHQTKLYCTIQSETKAKQMFKIRNVSKGLLILRLYILYNYVILSYFLFSREH